MSDSATIQTIHRIDLDELDAAVVADDDCGRHGCGDVIWVSERRPVEAIVDWLRTVARLRRCGEPELDDHTSDELRQIVALLTSVAARISGSDYRIGVRATRGEVVYVAGKDFANPPDASNRRVSQLDEREMALDHREAEVARREWFADERDRLADERDFLAAQRERIADERELRADEREGTAADREVARLRRIDEAAERETATAVRDEADVSREMAESERHGAED